MENLNGTGIMIDYDGLANGIYDLCKDQACLIYGMLPAEVMESFENNLKTVIPDQFRNIDQDRVYTNGKKLRSQVVHEVCWRILSMASKEGICIV